MGHVLVIQDSVWKLGRCQLPNVWLYGYMDQCPKAEQAE